MFRLCVVQLKRDNQVNSGVLMRTIYRKCCANTMASLRVSSLRVVSLRIETPPFSTIDFCPQLTYLDDRLELIVFRDIWNPRKVSCRHYPQMS